MKNTLPVLTRPYLAYALARMGDLPAAKAEIGRTPIDCYLCQRMRGRIAAVAGDLAGADAALQTAIQLAPSLPFAYVDRARLRLDRGDTAGAIADCALARTRSPHNADAAELWGEALLQRGQAQPAAGQFEVADRDAPHWARNHLFWSRALRKLGDTDRAAPQLHQARRAFAEGDAQTQAPDRAAEADPGDLAHGLVRQGRWRAARRLRTGGPACRPVSVVARRPGVGRAGGQERGQHGDGRNTVARADHGAATSSCSDAVRPRLRA